MEVLANQIASHVTNQEALSQPLSFMGNRCQGHNTLAGGVHAP